MNTTKITSVLKPVTSSFLMIAAFVCLIMINPVEGFGQKTPPIADPKIEAIEKHYQFLENEAKSFKDGMQKENEAYRKFIQEERVQHQNYLEWTITASGILVTVIAGFLTFFGWNTFKGIQDSRKELDSAAASQLVEFSNEKANRLVEFEKSLSDFKSRALEAENKFHIAESEYNRFLSYFSDANPKKGMYLMIGSQDKLTAMQDNEISRFTQAFGKPVIISLEDLDTQKEKFQPAYYDLIVYRSNVDDKGEDPGLQKIILELKNTPETPIVVYSNGVTEYIKGQTDKSLRENCLFHLATTPVSLIDNVASSYRVAKMLPKSK